MSHTHDRVSSSVMPLRGVHPERFWTPAWEIWVGLWNDLGDIGVCQAHRLSPCIKGCMMSRINFHAESRKFNRRLIRRTRPEAMEPRMSLPTSAMARLSRTCRRVCVGEYAFIVSRPCDLRSSPSDI